MPSKISLPEWLKNPEFLAKMYSYVYLIVAVYHVISFWYDVAGLWYTYRYVLIFIGFTIPPVVLGFVLLLAVHKRELQKTWICWLIEIALLCLYFTLYLVQIHGLSVKIVLVNLILNTALRILGLKVIYDYMLYVSSKTENGSAINRIDVTKTAGGNGIEERTKTPVVTPPSTSTNPFENVPLDDPWSGQEKM